MSEYYTLGTWNSQGVPDYLASIDSVDPTLISRIREALPEKEPVPTYHPEYLLSTTERNIIVKTDNVNFVGADIWVSFLDEGAGYRNVLGYFIYDLNDDHLVPTKWDGSNWVPMDYNDRNLVDGSGKSTLKKTVIFPNSSLPYKGGRLRPGSKVKLLYDINNPSTKFPNNIGVGFFVIPNGWNSGTQNIYNWGERVYTYDAFNSQSHVQSVVLNDMVNSIGDTGKLVIGFEDIMRPGGDKDFNDLIFQVDYNPEYSVQTNNFITLSSATPITQLSYKADKTGLYLKFPQSSLDIINASSATSLKVTQTIIANSTNDYQALFDIFNVLALSSGGTITTDSNTNTIIVTYNQVLADMTDFIYFVYAVDNSDQVSVYDPNVKNIVQFQNHFVYDVLGRISTETIKIEDADNVTNIFYNDPLRPDTSMMGSPLAMGDPHITTVRGKQHDIPNDARYVELLNDDKNLYISCSINKFAGNQRYYCTRNLTFIDKLFIQYENHKIIVDTFVPNVFYDEELNRMYNYSDYFKIEGYSGETFLAKDMPKYIKTGILKYKKLYYKIGFDVQYISFNTKEYGDFIIELLYVPNLIDKINSITIINESIKYASGTGALLNTGNYIIGESFPYVKKIEKINSL
jgi:Domain of unknown function (DUF4114)